ncbi:MAG: EAL domain-containing protein [Asticcacaulis sp.]|nr:EAL domain-containing protein [Asticcacaulis sp.]
MPTTPAQEFIRLRETVPAAFRALVRRAAHLLSVLIGDEEATDRVLAREMAMSLRPVVRGYLVAVCGYYIVNAILYRVPGDQGLMPALSVLTVVMSAGLLYRTRQTLSMGTLEVAGNVANFLLYLNTAADVALVYDPLKLIYFALLLPIYAISGPLVRVVLPATALSVVTFIAIVAAREPARMEPYLWIIFTGLTIGLCMSVILRVTIRRAVRDRITANHHRDEARQQADRDALTGLANRRSFFRQLEQHLASAGELPFDLALIDLDGFKPINDLYGHGVGDSLLMAVAERMRSLCGKVAFPARMGGDEFTILLSGGRSEEALMAFGSQLCDTLRETYRLANVTATISASVGFVRCDDAGVSPSQLLERADYALYYAKQNLRGAPVIFTDRHEAEMHDFSLVDQTLRNSDLDAELSIVFQPQFDLVDNRIVSFEALARWNSARLGPVRPDIFIKAAERSGLISRITLILLDKALKEIRTWPDDMCASFNLSAHDIRTEAAVVRIGETVKASGVDPRRIEFEITETAMLTDFDQACEALSHLKALGCRIAIDDFGSGYSSLGYLHRLPVDKIKIDRSFVVQLVRHGTTLKIIKTIIDLCRNLNLDCVVEGVETEAELASLREVRARYIQGYIFSKPIPADQVGDYLAAEEARLAMAS